MSQPKKNKIAIIGGGFCGIMTLVHLLKQNETAVEEIVLFNSDNPVSRGVAYSTYSNSHLLNVEARNMSAFPDQPDHFVEWLKERNPSEDPENLPFTFQSRNIYGDYLESIYNKAIQENTQTKVTVIKKEVIDIRQESQCYLLITKDRAEYIANKIVLATGNFPPASPPFSSAILQSGNYFGNPWKEEAVISKDDQSDILVLGNGLTMIDVVFGLMEKGFKGKIISLSPNGFGILPHRKFHVQRLILDELEPPYNLRSLFMLFYKHVRNAKRHGASGEAVVDAVRSKTQEIWQELSLKDKKQFLSHLRHMWGVARHRIPSDVYREMRKLIVDQKLEIIAGRLTDITEAESKLMIKYFNRRNKKIEEIKVSRIINCTGPQMDIKKQSELYRNMLEKKLISSDELNLGVKAFKDGRIIRHDGTINHNIIAIGSLLKGKLWESTAVPELRVQAKNTASLLLLNKE